MRKLLPLALTIGLSAVGFAQDSNNCMCTRDGSDMQTRMLNGKIIQEDKHTINVITPAPGQKMVSTYTGSYDNSGRIYTSSYNNSSNGDVKVRTDENGTVVQTDKTTINKVKPAPADYATLSNGYVMTPPSQNEVRITTDSHGNTIQTDKTTINKITPMSSDRMTPDRTTTVTGSDTMTTTHSGDYED